jgi:drug/metabolite transporter (DMT)-like permease
MMPSPLPVWLLPLLPPLFWAGNFVLARALHTEMPPVALSFWRWAFALALLLPFGGRALWQQRASWLPHWRLLTLLALLGVSTYNTLLYVGLRATTATNAVLLSSACPVFIVALSFLLLRERLRVAALFGLGVSLAGVALIVSAGEPARLGALALGTGDALVLLTALVWAMYSVLLRLRPAGLDPLGFLTLLVAIGLIPLVPLYAWELSTGAGFSPSMAKLAAIGYVALFPSVLAYVLWNRAIAELGANRTGQYIHLLPVFGTALGVLVLGERLAWFHAAGAGLIGIGIVAAAHRG